MYHSIVDAPVPLFLASLKPLRAFEISYNFAFSARSERIELESRVRVCFDLEPDGNCLYSTALCTSIAKLSRSRSLEIWELPMPFSHF